MEKEKNIVDFRGPRKKTKNLAKDKKFQLFSSILIDSEFERLNSNFSLRGKYTHRW